MTLKDQAYQHGRDHAHDYGIPSEDMIEWLEDSETNQDALTSWFARGVLDQRSGVVADEQNMLISYGG